MGDRANFGFKHANGDVIILYGHWAGHEMLKQLAHAVEAARPRWSDETYASRIAISQLINEDWNKETGWGLGVNRIEDNEHKIPIVDWLSNEFSLHEQDDHSNESNKVRGVKDEPLFKMDLNAFVDKYI